ncbi:hypothetical protein DL765_000402 [Monosporascus sp. GIB2]|nr:hypothetical protein DL765_000402 [Monosporascus sp. GIB2]
MSSSYSDLLDVAVGKDVREQYRSNLIARNNTPSIKDHFILNGQRPQTFFGSDTLWIVDRILEPQTVGKFLQAAMGNRPLPTGETIDQPLDSDELFLITRPISSWAPPPFDAEQLVPMDRIVELIGSEKEPDRMQLISKELQTMKSRLWEGIMPISARRWRERRLYDRTNFSAACRLLSMAINVFLYLNDTLVKAALRETFNLIDDALRTFENALNAKRAIEGKPAVEVCRKWHQFIRARYDLMVNRTFSWVMNHVDHMKSRILDQLDALGTWGSAPGTIAAEEQRKLFDMWQDISEIASQADYAILLPMDGYNGSPSDTVISEYDFHNEPLRAHPDIKRRNSDYHNRRGHWTLTLTLFQAAVKPAGDDPVKLLLLRQDAGQQLVRAELRGEPVRYGKEPWALVINERDEWGFVAYRACHSCSDAEWQEFRAKFDADNADWGSELRMDGLRERSKIHWVDVKGLGIDDEDIEALKRSFAKTAEFPGDFATDMFLVADAASVSSYLKPQSESSPPGEGGGFICAVDVDYDPDEGLDRPDESPGYGGTLRVLGSLLWDDLSAVVASHTGSLSSLWPLAMNHPSRRDNLDNEVRISNRGQLLYNVTNEG